VEGRLLNLSSVQTAIGVARRRLDWREADLRLGAAAERATIARTLAYLFGFGGVLLVLTLLLDGSPDRNAGALVLIGVAAVAFAAVLVVGYDRLPMRFLIVAPAAGSVLVGLVIGFAGPEASAPYAMYFAWVVIASAGFLSRTATAIHGLIAVAVYAIALAIVGPSMVPSGLALAMTAGTAAVAAVVMAGIAGQTRDLVARLDDAARTDPLTGLDNRRALRDEFERELARADRTRRPLALITLDLDHFKRFNDAFGHLAGDDALRRLARILDEVTRAIEVAARVGGEEFAVVAPETDAAGAIALAERVRLSVQSEFADSSPPLTVSCGIAVHRPGRRTPLDLFAAADRALYAAKRAGRNRVEVADERPPLELAGSLE
jgi:diguanylate cyclase (GGDEF)-like protein